MAFAEEASGGFYSDEVKQFQSEDWENPCGIVLCDEHWIRFERDGTGAVVAKLHWAAATESRVSSQSGQSAGR